MAKQTIQLLGSVALQKGHRKNESQGTEGKTIEQWKRYKAEQQQPNLT